ncbi:DUF3887 domain-containing protein [Candidatus Dependentiae bacterium]|nr:DUF3887 domain-containing protein [Candidatus Dependentiae bacterium]
MKIRTCIVFLSILIILLAGSCSKPPPGDIDRPYEELGEELVKFLVSEDYPSAVKKFDSVMKIALPAKKLKAAWKEQEKQFGKFISIEGVEKKPFKKYMIVAVKTKFQKTSGETTYLDVRLTYTAKKQVAGLFFVPSSGPKDFEELEYINRDSFSEEEITFGFTGWELPGVLTIPKDGAKFSVVILVHGSGPNDKDETIGPNKPFKDIAWGLATKGIAVFRYDKRTLVHGGKLTKVIHEFTVMEETVLDVVEAVKVLKEHDKIDPENIFILGHSLGGMMIPKISEITNIPKGYIIMAGTIRKIEDILIEQVEYISLLDGEIDATEKVGIQKTKDQIKEIKEIQKTKKTKSPQIILGASNKYWIHFDDYDICKSAKAIHKPVYIIQGERDYQVTMKDFQLWKDCLKGMENFSYKSYPGLNHLFIFGKEKSTPEEYSKVGHVQEVLIEDLSDWIKSQK